MNTYDFLLGIMFSKAEAQGYEHLPGYGGKVNAIHFSKIWIVLGCGERITIAINRGICAIGGNNLAGWGYPKTEKHPECTGIFKEGGLYDILFEDDDLMVKDVVFSITGEDQYGNRMELKDVATVIDHCGHVSVI